METPRIVSAEIKFPQTMFDGKAEVTAAFDTGEKKVVLRYYSDELCFVPSDFVGLTEEEVGRLFHKRDVAYLRS